MNTSPKKLTIREWSEDDRPREKMLSKGVKSLSDAELIAILIGSGNKNETAVELSRRILNQYYDNLNELARATVSDLCKEFIGIGEAKAISILAAVELGNRRRLSEALERRQIKSSKHLFELLDPILSDLIVEEFWVVLMNASNKVIKTQRITQGGSKQTIVDVPMILKLALEVSAQSIAVAHNHPSGNLAPSLYDDQITRKINEGCKAIGITLIDHLLVAQGKYLSYADERKL
jgi:DNA repair protein RadC